MPTEAKACPDCGSPLAADSPLGLCPQCLLQRGLRSSLDCDPADLEKTVVETEPRLARNAPGSREGQIFGRYQIVRLLGTGGMGGVYEAEHQERAPRRAESVESCPRFTGSPPALFARGTTGRFGESSQYDIKPSNCFPDTDGRVKVGDLGLSISTLAPLFRCLERIEKLEKSPADEASPGERRALEVYVAANYRGGLLMHVLGSAVVTRNGSPASRVRLLLRSVITWSPGAVPNPEASLGRSIRRGHRIGRARGRRHLVVAQTGARMA